MKGSGFRGEGLGVTVEGLVSRVWGFEFRVENLGLRGFEFTALGLGFDLRVWVFEFNVYSVGLSVSVKVVGCRV